jgi:FixJ family two-component response regulator
MPNKPLIAIIDDDESIRDTTKDLLESAGFSATTFPCAASFLSSEQLPHTACLVTDMRMPGMTGLELHRALVASGHPIPTVLIAAYPDDRTRARALKGGVICCLAKPFTPEVLLDCIRTALEAGTAGGRQA